MEYGEKNALARAFAECDPQLVAAAPDLLVALERIVHYYDSRTQALPMDLQAKATHENTMFGNARAAIAKAKGTDHA